MDHYPQTTAIYNKSHYGNIDIINLRINLIAVISSSSFCKAAHDLETQLCKYNSHCLETFDSKISVVEINLNMTSCSAG